MAELNPLKEYDRLIVEHPELAKAQDSVGCWTWTDKVILEDFDKLKSPELSITDRMLYLRAFYLLYFGELSAPINVGALFLNIVASTPHMTLSDKDMVNFSEKGTMTLTVYKVPSDLESHYQRFLADNQNQEDESEAQTETKAFKDAVITAFKMIDDDKNTDCHLGYRFLHLTATFLSLFLMRRLTKRPEYITKALTRLNIHKHYTDMVPNPFGITIPHPSAALNRALDQALSPATSAGKELYTIVLTLLQRSSVSASDCPVGLLGQNDVGMEAILRATCMTHIAGAGLPLITLFVRLQTLYNKTERATLEWLAYPELAQSITKIVRLRSEQCRQLEKKESLKLFPFCRLVHQKYHSDLGYRGNEEACYLMASLIDLRSPPTMGSGGASQAAWTKTMNGELKVQINLAAKAMYSKSTGFKLTAKYTGQINYNVLSVTTNTWKPEDKGAEQETEEDSDSIEDMVPIALTLN